MTLHEAASVFLILGGVLLGPIKKQLVVEEKEAYDECRSDRMHSVFEMAKRLAGGKRPTSEQMLEAHNSTLVDADMKPIPKCKYPTLEPIAETCERAMREIGARVGVDPGYYLGGVPFSQHTEHPHPEDEATPAPNGKWFVDGQRVLCIPAPTGLMR